MEFKLNEEGTGYDWTQPCGADCEDREYYGEYIWISCPVADQSVYDRGPLGHVDRMRPNTTTSTTTTSTTTTTTTTTTAVSGVPYASSATAGRGMPPRMGLGLGGRAFGFALLPVVFIGWVWLQIGIVRG